MKTLTKNILMIISGALLLAALAMFLSDFNGIIKDVVLISAGLIAGFPTFLKAVKSARMKMFSIEILVSIAVVGALIIGEYTEAAVVTFLFLFGAFLEIRTLEKARSSLKSLMDLQSLEATVIRDGKQYKILADEVEIGNHIIVRSGGKIPVDGKIISGRALINEAAITGESTLSTKEENDRIFSGTILDSGYLEIEAEKVGEDTAFAKILELVEEAQESKAKGQRFLEKFAGYYTPGILVLSVIVFLFTLDIHLSLTFLVIACPGALVISAPISIVTGIGKAAKNGILIKGGEIMERLAKMNALVFDKTGTLTKGKPEVNAIKTYGISETELLKIAAEAELVSEHHLGHAIIQKAKKTGIQLSRKPEEVALVKGAGIKVHFNGKRILIGNRKLLFSNEMIIPLAIENYVFSQEEKGNTAVFVANEEKILGIISIADQIRESAFTAIHQLKKNGIKHMVMLTGDNERTAKKVAQRLKIDQVFYELLPEEKANSIKSCMKKKLRLGMVGDGINDAPALATADIGIAVGGSGTDIALETADVILMTGDLNKLAYAQELAKATVTNMKQNMFFAVGIVFLLLIGVLMGEIHLASGMFIHELSVLLVILNAIRLVHYPKLQIRIVLWIKKYLDGFSFPVVLQKRKEREQYEINGCKTFSEEEFKKCSIC